MRVFVFVLVWSFVAASLPAVGSSSGGSSSSSKSPISAFTAVEWYDKGFEASEAGKPQSRLSVL